MIKITISLSVLLLAALDCYAFTISNPYTRKCAYQYSADLHSHPYARCCGNEIGRVCTNDHTNVGQNHIDKMSCLTACVKSYNDAGYHDIVAITEHNYVDTEQVYYGDGSLKLVLRGEEVSCATRQDWGRIGISYNITSELYPTAICSYAGKLCNAGNINNGIKHASAAGEFVIINHPNAKKQEWSVTEIEYAIAMGAKAMEWDGIVRQPPDIGSVFEKYLHILSDGYVVRLVYNTDFHQGRDKLGGNHTVIFSDSLTEKEIMRSLFEGNYYVTRSPTISNISVNDSKVSITWNNPAAISIFTKATPTGTTISHASGPYLYQAKHDDGYIVFIVYSTGGLYAVTNPLIIVP
jgi:hypothetical protein